MSEFIEMATGAKFYRARLLTTVCGLAFASSFVSTSPVRAEDGQRPTVWIELGSQLERLDAKEETFAPPFLSEFSHLNLEPVLPVQRSSRYAIGGEVRASFEPKGSDWVFSAAVRYGRSNGQKALYQRLPEMTPGFHFPPYHLNASASNKDNHVIVDFMAGKDVGLGALSAKISSLLSLGVRFAQFESRRKAGIDGVPDHFHSGTSIKYGVRTTHHRFYGLMDAEHDFQGVGPSISWDSSLPVISRDDEGINVDWGVNAAVLFGRQKVRGEANRTGLHYVTYVKVPKYAPSIAYNGVATAYHNHMRLDRSRSATVPNIGGFAGLSFRYSNAKIRLGYRADMFFNAIDGGIESHRDENVLFHGPYATISIGLGR